MGAPLGELSLSISIILNGRGWWMKEDSVGYSACISSQPGLLVCSMLPNATRLLPCTRPRNSLHCHKSRPSQQDQGGGGLWEALEEAREAVTNVWKLSGCMFTLIYPHMWARPAAHPLSPAWVPPDVSCLQLGSAFCFNFSFHYGVSVKLPQHIKPGCRAPAWTALYPDGDDKANVCTCSCGWNSRGFADHTKAKPHSNTEWMKNKKEKTLWPL